MSSEWPLVRLGNYVDSCLGKMLDAKKNKGTPQPYLGNSNVRWGEFDLADLAEMRFEAHEEERYSLLPGDLVVCEGGEPGRCAIWSGSPGMKIQKALHRIRPKEELDNYYLFYWFRHAANTGLLDAHVTGTTIKHLTGKAIAALDVPLPPVEVQRAMADVLRVLDDRIALLRETNATLEAIAQALFKSWFVDFDPVRAKQQGRPPESLDPFTPARGAPVGAPGVPPDPSAAAALFPDDFEDTELGPVPKGWRVKGIDQTCDLGRGSSPRPIQKFMGGDVPWIKIADATASDGMFVFETKESIIQDGVKNSVSVQPGDLIMSNSASCGITVFVELHGCIHDGWLYFKNYKETSKNFLFFWLRKIAEHLVHIADGSVQKNLNIALVSSQKILCPPSEILNRFDSIVGPLLERIRENCVQAQTLSTLRDTLLPRLISGQLRLPEADALLEQELV